MDLEERIDLLTQMFRDEYGLVERVARRYAPSVDLVDDIVQQTYLNFVSGTLEKQWVLKGSVRPLLFKIAQREALVLWRRRRAAGRAIDRLAERLLTAAGVSGESPEKNHVPEAELLALKHCLMKLSEKNRTIVNRHYFDNVSMKELAEEQQMKYGTLRHFFHRIRLKLRDCIERTMDAKDLFSDE